MSDFSLLGFCEPILKALDEAGYSKPTPIQAQAIPHLLAGSDLLGIAQTGTGKTAAFALPILERLLAKKIKAGPTRMRVLVLTPTRELASQVEESFATYGKHLPLSHTVIYGGVGERSQIQKMARGVDVLVATPGRLLDLMNQGYIHLDRLEVFILDEADRMLDMGFITDVRKIIKHLPKERQTLLFSATMPSDIARLAKDLLVDPVRVEVTPPASTVDRIEQKAILVDQAHKTRMLINLLANKEMVKVLVFTRTKHGANKVVQDLEKHSILAAAIHGNKSQNARERALENFRSGEIRVLVATDIAARGIDIDGICHVINYDLPEVPECYVHRIGRTARAGRDGIAISFCDFLERPLLRAIEKTIGKELRIEAGPDSTKAQTPMQKTTQKQNRKALTMRIWIDGDACPKDVKMFTFKASERLKIPVNLVANSSMNVPNSPLISMIRVEKGQDMADHYISQNLGQDDLVITADIPLAAIIVEKGAVALNPRGELYTEENVRECLSIRDYAKELRDAGQISGGPAPFGPKDVQRFVNALDRTLTRMRSGKGKV